MPIRADWLAGPAARSPEAIALWHEVHERDTDATVVSGPEWWRFLDSTFAAPHAPRMLVVTDSGRPVAVWPLAVRAERGRWLTIRTLCHANGYHTYYGDPVISQDAPPDTLERLLDALRRVRHVDAVNIPRLRILDLASNTGPDQQLVDVLIAMGADAPSIPAKMRRNMDRCHRRLEETGPVSIDWITGASLEGIGADFARLHTTLKLMQQQWQVFAAHPGSAERLGPALAEASRAIEIGAIRLMVGDTVQGLLIVVGRDGQWLTWRSAWEPSLARFGLGALLIREAIRICSARGDTRMHLGPGTESYKLDWASEVKRVSAYRCTRRTPATIIRTIARAIRS